MSTRDIAFIGGGNMARSLIGGLVQRGQAGSRIAVAEPVAALREALARDFGVLALADNAVAATGAPVWVLAVKPQAMQPVCAGLAALARAQRPLVISIAAGTTTGAIADWLDFDAAVVRAMPNTPALLGCGASGLYANAAVSPEQHSAAERIVRYLLREMEANHASSGVINLDIAKGLIASQLNLTQEHFSRILNELHRFGLIILDGRRIEIPKVDALQAYIPATA